MAISSIPAQVPRTHFSDPDVTAWINVPPNGARTGGPASSQSPGLREVKKLNGRQDIAAGPLIWGGLAGVATAELVVAVGLVVGVGYLSWKASQNPREIAWVIENVATEIQQKFSHTAGILKNLGIAMTVPSLDSIKPQIKALFGNIKNGVTSLQDAGHALAMMLGLQAPLPQAVVPTAVAPPVAAREPKNKPLAVTARVTPAGVTPPRPASPGSDAASVSIVRQQQTLARQGINGIAAAQRQLAPAAAAIGQAHQAMVQFYYAAAGGRQARLDGTPQDQVRAVQQARDRINAVVKAASDPIDSARQAAAGLQSITGNQINQRDLAPNIASFTRQLAERGNDLSEQRELLKAQVKVLDAWLQAAHRHVADGSQPLPPTPGFVISAGGDSASMASAMADARNKAQAALQASASRSVGYPLSPATGQPKTKEGQTATAAVPSTPSTPSTEVQILGYVNPENGQFSSGRANAGDLPVNGQWVSDLPAGAKRFRVVLDRDTGKPLASSSESNPNGVPVEGAMEVTKRDGKDYLTVYLRPAGGGGGPPNKPGGPDWKADALAAISVALSVFFIGGQLKYVHDSHEQSRVLQPDFTTANQEADKLLNTLGPRSTEVQIRDVQTKIWNHYFEVANATMKNARWAHVFNIPVLGGDPMFTSADLEQVRALQAKFIDSLPLQPVPSQAVGDPGFLSFNTWPPLEGDPLKLRHMNGVFDRSNAAVRERLGQIAFRLRGDDTQVTAFTSQPFDVKRYVQGHQKSLMTESGRKAAVVAVWRHHLDQVLPALGKRVPEAEQVAFRASVGEWLKSERLDLAKLVALPGNRDVQLVLATTVAAAGLDVETLETKFPQQRSFLDSLRQPQPQPPAAPQNATTPTPTTPAAPPESFAPAPDRASTGVTAPVASLPPSDPAAVLAEVQGVIKASGLNNPPEGQSLEALRFTPDMFFDAQQLRSPQAIDEAKERATALFKTIRSVGLANPALNTQFTQLLHSFNNDVLIPMQDLQPDNPIVSPSIQPSPSPTPPPTSTP